jgi:hydrogenase-4 component B
MLEPDHLFWAFTAIFFLGFLVPILDRRRAGSPNLSLALALGGSLLCAIVMGAIWLSLLPTIKTTIAVSSWLPDEWIKPLNLNVPELRLEFQIDRLSAFFGCLIAAFSALVAIYSFGALQAPQYHEQRHRIASAFNLFVWATLMVVIANDVFSLIMALEVMTLAFAYLALFKHTLYQDDRAAQHATDEMKQNARLAPQVYLIVSHVSTACLLIALILLALHVSIPVSVSNPVCSSNSTRPTFALPSATPFTFVSVPPPSPSLSFDALRNRAWALDKDPGLTAVIFLLALAGLGIRAGLTPAHFWVPLVHPSSPTTTHALSLGIAIKVAIYLMLRIFFQFLPPQEWWGYLVLLLAILTAFVNVWYAIASHDLKTALAYHSIENIGIILAGIGVALIFRARPDPASQAIAGLALLASLYHLLNHAVFKGLLYLATGAIDNQTRQVVEFHKLGGLIKIYPFVSAAFLVGAVSISGFPPFNGFVSEWLTLQALLQGVSGLKATATGQLMPALEIGILLFSLVMLAASFALTAFCFYKISGLALLGQPRLSEEARKDWAAERDLPRMMKAVMLALMLLCLVLGIMPGQVAPLLVPVAAEIKNINSSAAPIPITPSWTELSIPHSDSSSVNQTEPQIAVVALLLGAVCLALPAIAVSRRHRPQHPAAPWNCGTSYSAAEASYQPTSAALSFLLRDLLKMSGQRPKTTRPDYLPDQLEISSSNNYPQIVVEVVRAAYNRRLAWLLSFSTSVGKYLQNRDLRRYLNYIFISDIAILIVFILGKLCKIF